MSALVAGCFAPDLARFVFLRPHSYFGHTLSGVFLLDLPASILALWLFHAYAKQPLLMFLPDAARQRLRGGSRAFSFWPPARLMSIVLSILIGIATHLAWDSFTHKDTWPYRHWEFLRSDAQLPAIGSMAMTKVMEYGNSVLGVAILAVWLWHWYRTTEPFGPPAAYPMNAAQRRTTLVALPAIAMVGGILRALYAGGIPKTMRTVMHFSANVAITAIAFFSLGLLVCGVWIKRRAHREAASAGSRPAE